MAKSPTEIRNQALQVLGKLPLGQTPTAAWAESLDDAYTEVHAMLVNEGDAVWSVTDDVPSEYVSPVVALVAAKRVNVAGVPNDRYQRILSEADSALRQIKRLNAGNWINPRHVEDF